MRRLMLIPIILILAFGASACELGNTSEDSGAQKSESKARQSSYEQLVSAQPAKTMKYSPSRETINFWIDTWGTEGKLSFVYLMAGNGQIVGYYVLKGLPVSYCAALTPNYDKVDLDLGADRGEAIVSAPGVDGVYYSGGQCNQYFGIDATTGAYVEWSIGGSLNYLLFSEPIPVEAEPLGFTTIDNPEVQKALNN